ncbi:hypothetical protein H6G00_00735 [Leptolyngbya sp. FACHB-541]|uniref:hypothetical protein n=1 Tax=Leptolyngbya sp. FACHB-541 TaxID=2692810 RepID=UPI001681DC05|nr:hypothetical protein [Leptolyngbya sp. FACHB-541]MBD1995153.1 hypothetical protein [Leptolyngbya sp. FACHB-541]
MVNEFGRSITLTLGDFAIKLGDYNCRFVEGTYPREYMESPGVSFSAYGTAAGDGASYEYTHIWNLALLCEPDVADQISRMYSAFLLGGKSKIRLVDEVDLYHEPTPRTRAIAPGTEENISGGMTSYFAQFDAWFTAPPRKVQVRGWIKVALQLTEMGKVRA